MGLSQKGRYVYCADCGCRLEMNGICKICGHQDNPLLPGRRKLRNSCRRQRNKQRSCCRHGTCDRFAGGSRDFVGSSRIK